MTKREKEIEKHLQKSQTKVVKKDEIILTRIFGGPGGKGFSEGMQNFIQNSRYTDCKNYNNCLDIAIGWGSFLCINCPNAQKFFAVPKAS